MPARGTGGSASHRRDRELPASPARSSKGKSHPVPALSAGGGGLGYMGDRDTVGTAETIVSAVSDTVRSTLPGSPLLSPTL